MKAVVCFAALASAAALLRGPVGYDAEALDALLRAPDQRQSGPPSPQGGGGVSEQGVSDEGVSEEGGVSVGGSLGGSVSVSFSEGAQPPPQRLDTGAAPQERLQMADVAAVAARLAQQSPTGGERSRGDDALRDALAKRPALVQQLHEEAMEKAVVQQLHDEIMKKAALMQQLDEDLRQKDLVVQQQMQDLQVAPSTAKLPVQRQESHEEKDGEDDDDDEMGTQRAPLLAKASVGEGRRSSTSRQAQAKASIPLEEIGEGTCNSRKLTKRSGKGISPKPPLSECHSMCAESDACYFYTYFRSTGSCATFSQCDGLRPVKQQRGVTYGWPAALTAVQSEDEEEEEGEDE